MCYNLSMMRANTKKIIRLDLLEELELTHKNIFNCKDILIYYHLVKKVEELETELKAVNY